MKCLAREPADRFATGHALHDALVALRDGTPLRRDESSSRESEPRTPKKSGVHARPKKPSRELAQRVFKWSWSFKSSPEALWPHVADTDCFNEAVGLGPVDVELARESDDTMAREANASTMGIAMRWREYPFEWIKH